MVRLVPIVCISVIVLFQHFQIAHTLHGVGIRGNLGIYGGRSVSIAEVPYMAAVLHVKLGTNKVVVGKCGGSIIHERFILSAAHCAIDDNNPYRKVFVLVGSNSWSPLHGESLIKVEKTYQHKGYKKPYIFTNDICLFKLAVPVAFGPKVGLVNLADEDFEFEEGAMLTISGWGKTESDVGFDLRQVTIPLMSETLCRTYYPTTTDTEFCAGSENHGECEGDSGSPIMCDGQQIGLLSAGPVHQDGSSWCGTKYGGVYIKVTSYLQWINETIGNNL